jgi:hypothetical protein
MFQLVWNFCFYFRFFQKILNEFLLVRRQNLFPEQLEKVSRKVCGILGALLIPKLKKIILPPRKPFEPKKLRSIR